MERSQRIRLAIEIDPTAEPLSGWIARSDDTGHRDFEGWSGLAAALTLLLDERSSSTSSTSPDPEA